MRDALPGDGLSGSRFRANLTYSTELHSLPFKGRARVGMGWFAEKPIPLPASPLKGEEFQTYRALSLSLS